MDETGHAYLTGKTSSMDFPTSTGVFDSTYNGGDDGDAFLVKVDADGKSLVYATFLGGWASDIGSAIALDQSDRAYVAGHTWSSDFPITFNALDQSCNCGASAVFVSRLDVRGNLMEYSTFLGGSSWDYSSGIAVDRAGRAYVTGETYSSNFPTTPGAFDTSFNGDRRCLRGQAGAGERGCICRLRQRDRRHQSTPCRRDRLRWCGRQHNHRQ